VVIEIATKSPVTIDPISTPPQRLRPEGQPNHDRHQNGKQRRHDHFLDRRAREHVHRDAVFGLRRAFHDSLDLLELPAHLHHHSARGATHRFHRHRAEQIGHEDRR